MQCNCGRLARQTIGRDGKPLFVCASSRCRFFALGPVSCEGYQHVILTPQTPTDSFVIRFEALFHPDADEPEETAALAESSLAVLARVEKVGHVTGAAAYELDRYPALQTILEAETFSVRWDPVRQAYLYPMEFYPLLLERLRKLPSVLLEPIPSFFFRSFEQAQALLRPPTDSTPSSDFSQTKQECDRPGEDTLDPEDVVYRQLKPFQQAAVRYLLARRGRAMLADEMGLGKTVQAIAVAHHYRHEWPVLVLCPMSLTENWLREFNRFAGIPFARMLAVHSGTLHPTHTNSNNLNHTHSTRTAGLNSLHEVVVVSYSSLKPFLETKPFPAFDVVIVDESHYIKASTAKRSQLALRLCRAARRVMLLSGTPAMSRPMELFSQLQAVGRDLVPSRMQYAARYCNAFVGKFGLDTTGHAHPDELNLLLRHFMLRRTKRDVCDAELPAKTRQLLYICVREKERRALEGLVLALRRSVAHTSTHPPNHPSSPFNHHPNNPNKLNNNSLIEPSDVVARVPNAFELKIATARAKIPAVQDYVSSVIERHLEQHEKVILFAHHQCMMEALRDAVEAVRPRQPIDYIFISGETPAAQRDQQIRHFQTEPTCSVAILSMQSSGTGHNLTCARVVIFTELDWNPSTHLQCEDRVHRIGQASPCTVQYLLAEGTADSVLWPLLQAKLSVTTAVLEGATKEQLKNKTGGGGTQLQEGAARRQIARRSSSGGSHTSTTRGEGGTQGTLDAFLRPSQNTPTAAAEERSAFSSETQPPTSPPHSNNNNTNKIHTMVIDPDNQETVNHTHFNTNRHDPATPSPPLSTPPMTPPVVVIHEDNDGEDAKQKREQPGQPNASADPKPKLLWTMAEWRAHREKKSTLVKATGSPPGMTASKRSTRTPNNPHPHPNPSSNPRNPHPRSDHLTRALFASARTTATSPARTTPSAALSGGMAAAAVKLAPPLVGIAGLPSPHPTRTTFRLGGSPSANGGVEAGAGSGAGASPWMENVRPGAFDGGPTLPPPTHLTPVVRIPLGLKRHASGEGLPGACPVARAELDRVSGGEPNPSASTTATGVSASVISTPTSARPRTTFVIGKRNEPANSHPPG